MFHQNSNDLVKNASLTSGHVQNSSGTREALMKQANANANASGNRVNDQDIGMSTGGVGASLSIGAKIQNMIQSLIDTVSLKEGIGRAGAGAGAGPADPSTGTAGGNNADQSQFISDKDSENKEYTQQEVNHISRVANIMNLIDLINSNNLLISNHHLMKDQ